MTHVNIQKGGLPVFHVPYFVLKFGKLKTCPEPLQCWAIL